MGRGLFEKLIVTASQEIPCLLLNLNVYYNISKSVTGPNHEPHEFSPLRSILSLILPSGHFPLCFPLKFCIHFPSTSCVLHAPPISFFFLTGSLMKYFQL
jgi:hypothetical protein